MRGNGREVEDRQAYEKMAGYSEGDIKGPTGGGNLRPRYTAYIVKHPLHIHVGIR